MTGKILIIDDDKELCALIKQSILQENIDANFCYSGKSGLEKLKGVLGLHFSMGSVAFLSQEEN